MIAIDADFAAWFSTSNYCVNNDETIGSVDPDDTRNAERHTMCAYFTNSRKFDEIIRRDAFANATRNRGLDDVVKRILSPHKLTAEEMLNDCLMFGFALIFGVILGNCQL